MRRRCRGSYERIPEAAWMGREGRPWVRSCADGEIVALDWSRPGLRLAHAQQPYPAGRSPTSTARFLLDQTTLASKPASGIQPTWSAARLGVSYSPSIGV